MKKLTKKSRIAIAQLASIFPDKPMKESHRVNVYGSELIKAGTLRTNDDQSVRASELYTSVQSGAKKVNHKNRMEAAFQLGGREGVMKYGQGFLKAENHADWDRTVNAVFDYEEKGIVTPVRYQEAPVEAEDESTVDFTDFVDSRSYGKSVVSDEAA